MMIAVAAAVLIAVLWALTAAYAGWRLGLAPQQAILYAPLKLVRRIDDGSVEVARSAEAPVIYAVSHSSLLDPTLMLSLLPGDTLHILDETAARSMWLEPWRDISRTIVFNARHVFVSRRLVRRLRGNGRIAVYFPASIRRDTKQFRLFRAVAKIATRAEARIVAIAVADSRGDPQGEPPYERGALSPVVVRALAPMSVEQLVERAGGQAGIGTALYERLMQAYRGTANGTA